MSRRRVAPETRTGNEVDAMNASAGAPSLASAVAQYGFAYLMTTNAKGAPHAVAVDAVLQDGELRVDRIGNRTRENARARPAVGLVWPPPTAAGYSLIVDGHAAVAGDSLRITPTRAILHRPAPPAVRDPSKSCASDCLEIDLEAQTVG
jgi:hypothetical protein